ncbi:hypothetical protein BN1013_01321 [Candidatus Rubidus massiliensis]|nr:hypothetical protein BN1013_01321 [Candidatus Rubidus massiliensis]
MNSHNLHELERALSIIFALPVSKMTLREIQNAFVAILQENRQIYTDLFESFVHGQAKFNITKILPEEENRYLKQMIEKYSLLFRVAIDVHDRGDFLNLITSDMLPPPKPENNPNKEAFFINHVKRIDGQEFHYVTDTTNIVHLIDHYIMRLQEIATNPGTKEGLQDFKPFLKQIASKLETISK